MRRVQDSFYVIVSYVTHSTNVDGVEIGDPTETALINLGTKLGATPEHVRGKFPRTSEIPFDSDRKLMSTSHVLEDGPVMLTKGAVDVLLTRMNRIWKKRRGYNADRRRKE